MKLKSAEHFPGAGRFDRRHPLPVYVRWWGRHKTPHVYKIAPYISSLRRLLSHERCQPFTLLAAAALRHAPLHWHRILLGGLFHIRLRLRRVCQIV